MKICISKLCLLIFFIDRILQNENPYPRIFDDPVIQLFGAKFVKANALTQHMETLFFLLRYKISNLDNVVYNKLAALKKAADQHQN